MKTLAILFLILALPITAAAQPPDTLWTRMYGGDNHDYGYGGQQTLDGGYVIAGVTDSFGATNSDVYVVKTDISGNLIWQRTYGGTGSDIAFAVQQTSDSGYVMAGRTNSPGANFFDVYLIKTDFSGAQIWQRIIGGSNLDEASSVQQTTDGGYIMCGGTSSYGAGSFDVLLVKTDAAGNVVWQSVFGGSAMDWGYSVQQTGDEGYVVAGFTDSFGIGYTNVYLIRTDAAGNLLWQRTYGGTMGDWGNSVQQTTDGGYIITGYTTSQGGGYSNVLLIKTDVAGNQVWQNVFGGGSYDDGYSVKQTLDGGYVIAGVSLSFGNGSEDVYMVKTDAGGNLVWQRTFGGNEDDRGLGVQQTAEGGYAIFGGAFPHGINYTDVCLIKTVAGGNVPLNVTLTPLFPPIYIPANGGSFNFNASVANYGAQNTFWVWARIKNPNGSYTTPTLGPVQINPPVGVQITRQRIQTIPGAWPTGVYNYLGYAHATYSYPATDSSSFTFTKSADADGGATVWKASCMGELFPGEVGGTRSVVSLSGSGTSPTTVIGDMTKHVPPKIAPNPFNATTVISFELRVASIVQLEVFDINGCLVGAHGCAPLQLEAGAHQIPFDGSDLPSGIYFAKLIAGDFNAVQKLVLLK